MKPQLNRYTLNFNNRTTELRYRLYAYPKIVNRFTVILWVALIMNIVFVVRNYFGDFAITNTSIRIYGTIPALLLSILTLKRIKRADPTSYLAYFQVLMIFIAVLVIGLHIWIVYYEPLESGKNVAYTILVLLSAFIMLSGIPLISTLLVAIFFFCVHLFVVIGLLHFSFGESEIEITTLFELILVVVVAKYFEDKHQREIFLQNEVLVQQNATISDSLQTLTEKNDFQRTLIGYLAHDVRGPMNNLKGILNIFKLEYKGESKDIINNIENEFSKTETMLNNMLYWIKSQTEGFELRFEKITIGELIRPAVELYQRPAAENGVDLIVEIDRDVHVKVDVYALDAVIRNLISNSLKYCYQGDKIEIISKVHHSLVSIFVKDSGEGIAPEILERINLNSKYGEVKKDSFGLGLQICRDMLARHGSSLDIMSELDKGTIVSFELAVDKD